MPKIDLGNIEEQEPLPAGTYEASLTENWSEEEGDKGSYIKFEFLIEDEEFEGRKMYSNASMAAQALWRFKKTLLALGAKEDEIDGEIDTDEIIPDLVGNSCRLRIARKQYEGETVNEVRRILPSE